MLERRPLFPHVIELNHAAGHRIGCCVYLVYDGDDWLLLRKVKGQVSPTPRANDSPEGRFNVRMRFAVQLYIRHRSHVHLYIRTCKISGNNSSMIVAYFP